MGEMQSNSSKSPMQSPCPSKGQRFVGTKDSEGPRSVSVTLPVTEPALHPMNMLAIARKNIQHLLSKVLINHNTLYTSIIPTLIRIESIYYYTCSNIHI